MVHREAQTQRLFSLLRPIVEAGASSNAFLYGAVGTGKTHTAKRFCLDFRKYASESNRAVDWDVVNCRQRMGDDAVLLRLLQHFDPHFPERGFSIAEKMESLRKHLEKHKLHFIVILDEVDALLKKSGADLIYSFARIAEEGTTTKGNISMILISQRPNALEYMDPAALSTFRRTNVVEFPRYDRAELEDIVQGRVALAMHPGTVDDDLIDLIADIASEFGDARYAIELLEKAGMLADEERADRKSTRLNSSHSQISYAVFCLKKKQQCQISARAFFLYLQITLSFPPFLHLFYSLIFCHSIPSSAIHHSLDIVSMSTILLYSRL